MAEEANVATVDEGSVFQRRLNPRVAELEPASAPPRPEDISVKVRIPVDQLVRLSANESPLGPSPKVREALKAAADSPELHRYPDRRYKDLTSAMAAFVGVQPEFILPTAGASEVLPLALRAFCSDGDIVAYIHPGIPRVGREAASGGLTPLRVTVPWPYDMTAAAVMAGLSEEPALVFITSPNNTTSRLMYPEEVAALCGELPNSIVYVDEHYVEAADSFVEASAASLFPEVENLIVARTFSKVHGMAGLRVGYAVAPPSAIKAMRQISARWPVSVPAEAAALAALGDRAHLEENRALVKTGRDYLVGELSLLADLEVVPDPQGNFILARSSYPPRQVMEALWEHGVLINGFLLEGHIRITVGTDEMNRRVVEGLQKVLAVLRQAG